MNEYELHVSACYTTDGGTREWNCFTEYREAATQAEAIKNLKAELKEEGYRRITAEATRVRA